MFQIPNINKFSRMILTKKPAARASVKGGKETGSLHGYVNFYPADNGTLLVAELYNLPNTFRGETLPGFFGFHIHAGNACTYGSASDPFASTKAHFNPTDQRHPLHAGDLPVLLSNDGYEYLSC